MQNVITQLAAANDVSVTKFLGATITKFLDQAANDVTVTKFLDASHPIHK